MNFYEIYESIKLRCLKENANSILESAKTFIKKDNNLFKQYYIFESVLKKKQIDEKEAIVFISLLEDYCKNLDYSKLEESNKKFISYFNLKNKKSENKIFESIDDMIRYNSGGVYNLKKGTEYRNEIVNYLTKEKIEESTIISANKKLIESYNSLTNQEKIIFETIKRKKYSILENKIKLIEKKLLKETGKNKELGLNSILVLKEKIKNKQSNFENLTYEIISLYESLILEGKFGPGTEKKVPNLDLFKNITVSCSENKNRPEQVIIDFDFIVPPKKDTSYSDQIQGAKEFEKKYSLLSKSITKSIINKYNDFNGDFIFDGVVPTTGLSNVKPSKITGELYLDTKNEGPEFKSFDGYLKPTIDFLINFEKEFKNKFKEDLKN